MTYEFETYQMAQALEAVERDERWATADHQERAEILRDELRRIVGALP